MSTSEERTDVVGKEPVTGGQYLELPGHIKTVGSSSSLPVSENSDADELDYSKTSVGRDDTSLALIEGCVGDVALVPIHFQELLTNNLEEIFPSSPLGSEKDSLLMPTSPHSPKKSDEKQRTRLEKYLLWGRLSGPFLAFALIGIVIIVLARSHLSQMLDLLEHLPWFESCVVFILLFTLVAFPFGIGYIVLNMVAGYLYGFLWGQLVVMISVTIGFTVSFFLCRIWFRDYAKRIVTSNALQAIMRVVEGKSGMKVIILTRLTPIPFGLQNTLFAVSNMYTNLYNSVQMSYLKCLQALLYSSTCSCSSFT